MKILVLAPGIPTEYRDGFMPFISEQVKNLSSVHEITLVVPISRIHYCKRKYLVKGQFFDKPLSIDNVKIIPVYFWSFPGKLFYNMTIRIVRRKISNIFKKKDSIGNFDIIHAHFLDYCGVIAHYLSEQMNTPMMLTEHTSNVELSYGRFDLKRVLGVLNRAFCIVTVSEELKKKIVQKTLVNKNKFKVIPNGIDFFKFDKDRFEDLTIFKIIFIGHLIERKGLDLLLDALKLIKQDTDINLSLTVVGQGEKYAEYQKFIDNNKLNESVEFIGQISNDCLPSVLSQNHLLVLPSRAESFGVVVIEANAAGLPAVVTRCGGPETIITNDKLGEVIETDNVEQMVKSILKIYNNYSEYSASDIKEITKNKYDWSIVIKSIGEIYNSNVI